MEDEEVEDEEPMSDIRDQTADALLGPRKTRRGPRRCEDQRVAKLFTVRFGCCTVQLSCIETRRALTSTLHRLYTEPRTHLSLVCVVNTASSDCESVQSVDLHSPVSGVYGFHRGLNIRILRLQCCVLDRRASTYR